MDVLWQALTARTPLEQEAAYLQKMTAILTNNNPGSRVSSGPAMLLDHLLLGNRQDAQNLVLLKRLKVTHVLNCAGKKDYSHEAKENPYDPEQSTVREYLQFEALDNESYPIMMHYKQARAFINNARRENGRALVHCEMGVNRSAALCLAYVMEEEDLTLLQAVRRLKIERPVVLCNEGFRKQLYHFALERNMLHDSRNGKTPYL